MIALAVPIAAENGHLFATLSFHAPILRMSMGDAHAHLAPLREGAEELRRIAYGTLREEP